VKKALPRLGAGAFLIHNSDSVWIEGIGANLTRLVDAWDEPGWTA
jgi:MurNAc alpha-1-phosphate uridylyltransferase